MYFSNCRKLIKLQIKDYLEGSKNKDYIIFSSLPEYKFIKITKMEMRLHSLFTYNPFLVLISNLKDHFMN